MSKGKSAMTPNAASRIQSAAAKNQSSGSFKSSFYQRAQSVAAKGSNNTAGKMSSSGKSKT